MFEEFFFSFLRLMFFTGVEGICQKLKQTIESGPADADIIKRKEEFGANILPKAQSKASCQVSEISDTNCLNRINRVSSVCVGKPSLMILCLFY